MATKEILHSIHILPHVITRKGDNLVSKLYAYGHEGSFHFLSLCLGTKCLDYNHGVCIKISAFPDAKSHDLRFAILAQAPAFMYAAHCN